VQVVRTNAFDAREEHSDDAGKFPRGWYCAATGRSFVHREVYGGGAVDLRCLGTNANDADSIHLRLCQNKGKEY
jgi:hypothetical protein